MAFCSSTKFPTTLLRFRIACSTRDEDGGGCGWDEDSYCCCAAEGTYAGGFGFQERLGWFLQLGLYVLLYWALVDGLYWPTTLACLAIKSLIEGAVGQCSPWCSVDWEMEGTPICKIALLFLLFLLFFPSDL